MLAVALIVPPVEQKTLRNVFIEHFLAKFFHDPDILSQPVKRQAGENIRRRPVIADQPVVIVQRDHSVPQTLQNFCSRQMAEIIIPAAPDHNDHHRHRDPKRYRRKIKYRHPFTDIGGKHKHRQGRNPQNRPILTIHLPVRAFTNRSHQCVDTKRIGNDNPTKQKQHIQRSVSDADMIKSVRSRTPADFLIKQTVPVKKYRRKHKKANCA
ncbi:hypothetical protein IMSAGC012_01237 [Lachnospiraceae bacterium]|nr:hypothetical protein IMSAGC012_01237 [Lachnospiraceae bacterium]